MPVGLLFLAMRIIVTVAVVGYFLRRLTILTVSYISYKIAYWEVLSKRRKYKKDPASCIAGKDHDEYYWFRLEERRR